MDNRWLVYMRPFVWEKFVLSRTNLLIDMKQYFTVFCPWLPLLIQYLVTLDTCNAEENIGENLDAKIAFDVPGTQQPISFASSDHSTGFVMYCPCMGKLRDVMKNFQPKMQ